jgi:cell division septation protein DedD
LNQLAYTRFDNNSIKKVSDLKQSLTKEGETGNYEYDVQVGNVKQSQSKEDETGNDEYDVQVVALKNHDDAQKLLVKITKYYPEAYIVVDSVNYFV